VKAVIRINRPLPGGSAAADPGLGGTDLKSVPTNGPAVPEKR